MSPERSECGCRRLWARLPRPAADLSCRCCNKPGGSILNGRYWYHIAFPFTPKAGRSSRPSPTNNFKGLGKMSGPLSFRPQHYPQHWSWIISQIFLTRTPLPCPLPTLCVPHLPALEAKAEMGLRYPPIDYACPGPQPPNIIRNVLPPRKIPAENTPPYFF